MPSHLLSSLTSLSSVLFCSWNVPTFVYLFKCVCPSIIFPARLPAECRTVWINETELTGLLMKACLHTLHFLRSLCTWEPLGEVFYIWVFVVLLIKACGNGLVFVKQAFLIPNSFPCQASSAHPPFLLPLSSSPCTAIPEASLAGRLLMAFSSIPAGTSSQLAILSKLNSFSHHCSSQTYATIMMWSSIEGLWCQPFTCRSAFSDTLFWLELWHPSSPWDIKGSSSSLRNFRDQLLAPRGYLHCLFKSTACLCSSWFFAPVKKWHFPLARSLSCSPVAGLEPYLSLKEFSSRAPSPPPPPRFHSGSLYLKSSSSLIISGVPRDVKKANESP